ncbi:MAG: hypothetical protein CBB71_17460 [Rhodopirellula sp. TMED11]|nr:MAG: hypothetical protein CBB71_17460 [Rhodopirellula sp. TMED11]
MEFVSQSTVCAVRETNGLFLKVPLETFVLPGTKSVPIRPGYLSAAKAVNWALGRIGYPRMGRLSTTA